LGLGKRIRNPSSNHDIHHHNYDHHGSANNYNHHGSANNHYNEHDHNYDDNHNYDVDNDYYHCPWLTSFYGRKGCIFLELGSHYEPFRYRREFRPYTVALA
jgi:hypothetical protein